MSNKIAPILLVVLLFAFAAGGWSLLFAAAAEPPAPGLIRLHIVANSDSAADQHLKLLVRDAVTAYLAPHLAGATTVDDARLIVRDRKEDILAVARHTAAAAGVAYPVAIESGWHNFPARAYGSLVLPPGRYETVRILLGAAEGKNWWCVLFPPLCFIDGATAVAVPALGGTQEKSSADSRVELRWKIRELLADRENQQKSNKSPSDL